MKRFLIIILLALLFTISSYAQFQIPPPNKAVLFKATSTECNICGLLAWDELKDAIDLYEKDAVIIAVHPLEESLLHTPTSTALIENVSRFFGTPSFYVNNEQLPFQWLGEARLMIEAFQEREIIAHPSVDYIIEDNQLKVEVKTKYFKPTNRAHYVAAYVIENKVEEFQDSRQPEDLHSKILRTHIGEEIFGTLLSESDIIANQEFTNYFTMDIAPEWAAENLEIAIIIWEQRGTQYDIINSNIAFEPSALSTSINILEATNVAIKVQPTIIANSATIQLDLPTALEGLNLSVANSLGQQVKSVFTGDLPQGKHTFSLNRNDYTTAGLYFLVVEKDGDSIVEKIVLK